MGTTLGSGTDRAACFLIVSAMVMATTACAGIPPALVIAALCAARASERTPTPANTRPSVCVIDFENNTGDSTYNALRGGLAEMVLTDIAGAEGLRVVERRRIKDVLQELELQSSDLVDQETAGRIGKLIGADNVVTGAIAAVKPQIRIDIRLIRVQSGEVILADRIVGRARNFFELQQALAKRFVDALGAQLGPSKAGRVDELETVVEFSRGLDLAERGELDEASKRLSRVVTKAPSFTLAQSHYEQVMRRLMAAKKRRAGGLTEADRDLFAKADSVLETIDVYSADRDTLQRLFGYRYLRGRLILARIVRCAGGIPDETDELDVPEDRRAEMVRLVAEYVDNQKLLVRDLVVEHARTAHDEHSRFSIADPLGGREVRARGLAGGITPSRFPEVDHRDEDRAEKLGVEADYHFVSPGPYTVKRDLAALLCCGNLWPLFTMTPAPADVDSRWEKRALTFLNEALEDIKVYADDLREDESVEVLATYGDCLLARGRKMEAIARWQQILDTYPTTEEFADIEERIREALGDE